MMRALYTPHLFTPTVVRPIVIPDMAGSYILGSDEDGFLGHYVGRSDTSLLRRLLTHNHLWRFEYFIFQYAHSPPEAYALECAFWHDGIDSGRLINR